MADYQSKVSQTLDKILQQTQLSRNEICCKLRDINNALGGGTDTHGGLVKLTGTATFDTADPPTIGDKYVSVSVSVISTSSGTVTVTDSMGVTTDITYTGLNLSWNVSDGLLSISTTGSAVAMVTYITT